MTKRFVLAIATAMTSVALAGLPSTADAKAIPVGQAHVKHPTPKGVYVAFKTKKHAGEYMPRLRVQFNDMSVYDFTHCRVENERNCWWTTKHGTKVHVNLKGKTKNIPVSRIQR